ncbi:MAG: hypothetical protein AVDCRST_MAG71-552, partial [uncultured Lysobacter sp.]
WRSTWPRRRSTSDRSHPARDRCCLQCERWLRDRDRWHF